jgi:hypothetical protein
MAQWCARKEVGFETHYLGDEDSKVHSKGDKVRK